MRPSSTVNLCTAFLVVLWLVWVHQPLHPYRKNQIKYQLPVRNLLKHDAVERLILSDSHGERLIYGQLNNGTMNLSKGGDGTKEMLIKFKVALMHSDKIRHVLLSVDPHMFSSRRLESSKAQFLYPILPATILKDVYGKSYFEIFCIKTSPLLDEFYYSFEKERMSRFIRGESEKSNDKKLKQWQESDFESRVALSNVTGRNDFVRLFRSKRIFDNYREIRRLCLEKNITVFPVIFPAHKGYYEMLNEGDVQKIIAFTNELKMAPLLSAPENLLESDDFIDPDHLSEDGARKMLMYLRQTTGVSW